MYHLETFWLPENGDKSKAPLAGHGNPGGFQFIAKSAFTEIGGYDEEIVYWGYEDLDWPSRLKNAGYKQEWLPKEYKIYHQWHKKSESSYKRPTIASFNTFQIVQKNTFKHTLPHEWGKEIILEDRPILKMLKNVKPIELVFVQDSFIFFETAETILHSKKDTFVKLNLGSRLKKRPLDKLSNLMQKILKPFCALTGNKVIANVNTNFDALYAILPVLMENGLRDYYISSDLTEVYLLWNE